MKTVIVIPARFGSNRLPGKALRPIGGQPLIKRVWEQARSSRRAHRVVVATDDARIRDVIESAGGEAIMTEGEFRSGTDRMAWVARRIPAEAYLNLQGDELIWGAEMLDDLIEKFIAEPAAPIGTLCRAILRGEEELDPNVVKVVMGLDGYALYFSRAPIPVQRDRPGADGSGGGIHYKHLGIYIFQAQWLHRFSELETGRLEEFEKLEQLRALEHGIRIRVWETRHDSLRIDAPEDIRRAEADLTKAGPGRGR